MNVSPAASPPSDPPAVSVIIVNWNTRALLQDCLASIGAQTTAPHEVIVIDNASHDGSAAMVSAEFPQVRLVSFDKGRATEEQAVQLGLQRSAPVYLIENVLSLQGRPAIYDHITLSVARFPGLSRSQFEGRSGTIYGLYQNEFGVTVVGVKRAHEDFQHATPDTRVLAGDLLIVSGPTHKVEHFAGHKSKP